MPATGTGWSGALIAEVGPDEAPVYFGVLVVGVRGNVVREVGTIAIESTKMAASIICGMCRETNDLLVFVKEGSDVTSRRSIDVSDLDAPYQQLGGTLAQKWHGHGQAIQRLMSD